LRTKVWIPINILKCCNGIFIITIGLNIFIGIVIAIGYYLKPETIWDLIQIITPLWVLVFSLSILILIPTIVIRKRRIMFQKVFSEGIIISLGQLIRYYEINILT